MKVAVVKYNAGNIRSVEEQNVSRLHQRYSGSPPHLLRNADTAAETDYIHPFSAALHKDNFYATQFHPEKSGKTGERILRNFLDL